MTSQGRLDPLVPNWSLGGASSDVVVLLTPEEIDSASKLSVDYPALWILTGYQPRRAFELAIRSGWLVRR